MSGFSTYLDNKLIDHVFSGVSFETPSKYLALFTASTGLDVNSGWENSELPSTAAAYARVELPHDIWSTADNGETATLYDTQFAVANSHWGNVTHVGIMDSAIGGNVLAWGALANPVTGVTESRNIETGDQLVVRAGALNVTLA